MLDSEKANYWRHLELTDGNYNVVFLFPTRSSARIIVTQCNTTPCIEAALMVLSPIAAIIAYTAGFVMPLVFASAIVLSAIVHALVVPMGIEIMVVRGLGLQHRSFSRLSTYSATLREAFTRARDPSSCSGILMTPRTPHLPTNTFTFYPSSVLRGPFIHEAFFRWHPLFLIAFGVDGASELFVPFEPPLLPRLALLQPLLDVLRGVLHNKGPLARAVDGESDGVVGTQLRWTPSGGAQVVCDGESTHD